MRGLNLIIVVGAVAVLSACDGQPPAAARDGATTVRDAPVRRPGLWRQVMLIEGTEGIRSLTLCLDAAADQKLSWWGGGGGLRQGCSRNLMRKTPGGAWKFESVCETTPGVQTQMAGEVVGNFQEKYQMRAETTTRNSPVLELVGARTVSIDAEWLGPCPADMQAGEAQFETGQRVNLLQIGSSSGF